MIALEELLARVAPALQSRFHIEIGGQGFEYQVASGKLAIRAEDQIAAAAGFHHYCTNHIGQRYTWGHPRIDIPNDIADVPTVTGRTELEHRYYLNFVTSAYSAAFWDWPRWEQEIDWMALHAINRPLVTVGHEAILYQTYRSSGMGESAALEWLGSPAHLPWTFMGGLNSWGGPMSTTYLDDRLNLALRVLDRMRCLGMSPVLPGFGGQAPACVAGDADCVEWQGWRTPFLDPGTTQFRVIAAEFYALQQRHLGTADFFAIDPFIESIPPREDPEWLTDAAAGIHGALSAHNPNATWILQAWPFHYHREYWELRRVEAFVNAVTDERLLLLDLWAEFAPVWERTREMFGKPWIWCATHNFGGRFALFGDLEGSIKALQLARRSPVKGKLLGFGLTMEAIENNEVFYELMLDQVWECTPLDEWLARWAEARYNTSDSRATRVWQILAGTLYSPGRSRSTPSPVIARPWDDHAPYATQRLAGEALHPSRPFLSANIDAENDPSVLEDLPALVEACLLLLELPSGDHRSRDLQEILLHVVAQHARWPIRTILHAYARDPTRIGAAADDLSTHIEWLDRLAGTRPTTLVGTWLAAARARAHSQVEADLFELDARSLITVWGNQLSGLHDYSGRHWAGLLRDFYLPRWRIWAAWLASGAGSLQDLREQIVQHEESWRRDLRSYPTETQDATDAVARAVIHWLGTHETNPLNYYERIDRDETITKHSDDLQRRSGRRVAPGSL